MIEVERKYKLNPKQESALLKDAQFLGSVTNEDHYFDTADLALAKANHWLRCRNGAWELKRRLGALGVGFSKTAYEEITDEGKIREFLGLVGVDTLEADLLGNGYQPFVTLIKQRRKYQRGSFHIDLDVCDFGYEVAEIETIHVVRQLV